MPTGTVIKWVGNKGSGIIVPADGSVDVFVHKKCLSDGNDSLTIGEEVQYEAEWNQQTGKMTATSCSG